MIGSISTISGTFHSLFNVLFFFRSHYFFAIGLQSVFSVARDLPRTSNCTPKQSYSTCMPNFSMNNHNEQTLDGTFTLLGVCFHNSFDLFVHLLFFLCQTPNATIQALIQPCPIFTLHFSLFTRRYYGNRCYFLFLPLIICLNSGGFLIYFRAKFVKKTTEMYI